MTLCMDSISFFFVDLPTQATELEESIYIADRR
jgi:hypothetical protein